jgi:Protein of unknown function (DUF2867)
MNRRSVEGFPHVSIANVSGGLPVEVTLISQLGPGAGDLLAVNASTLQRRHSSYVDELQEPSARLGGVNLDKGDASSLYSFVVGAAGHPFHRHQGHRVFTAISGSGGAQLRFSTASDTQMQSDPQSFVRALRYVNIPPDSLFTVRFGGGTWHQFVPLTPESGHPAFFALSCHTNELGGELDAALREQVLNNAATIPALTEVLPESVASLLASLQNTPTTHLSLYAPHGSGLALMCQMVRRVSGKLRSQLAKLKTIKSFAQDSRLGFKVHEAQSLPQGSLLSDQLKDRYNHEDSFSLIVPADLVSGRGIASLLADVLDGFLQHPPASVGMLMHVRNLLVQPLGLRRSHLGCPISSLAAESSPEIFSSRFSVWTQAIDLHTKCAQVILGADDKHLQFRTCVAVQALADGSLQISMSTRVRCLNRFGYVYMALIDFAHRKYISPLLLRRAVLAASEVWLNQPDDPLLLSHARNSMG